MKKMNENMKHYFRDILGAISINEILQNKELINCASKIESILINNELDMEAF